MVSARFEFRFENLKSISVLILFVYKLMTGSSKNNRENYPRNCFWTQEKESRVKFNPGALIGLRATGPWTLSFALSDIKTLININFLSFLMNHGKMSFSLGFEIVINHHKTNLPNSKRTSIPKTLRQNPSGNWVILIISGQKSCARII